MSWTNEDGLLVRFNTERGAVRKDGTRVGKNEFELVYDLNDATTLGDTDTAAPPADEVFVPAGAIITEALFVVDTTFTGATAVLDIGLKQSDGTNIDDDGIDAAIAVADLTARSGHLSDGALIGDIMEFDSYVMFTYDTAAFTAGAGRLIVKYVID